MRDAQYIEEAFLGIESMAVTLKGHLETHCLDLFRVLIFISYLRGIDIKSLDSLILFYNIKWVDDWDKKFRKGWCVSFDVEKVKQKLEK